MRKMWKLMMVVCFCLPICFSCKKISTSEDAANQIDEFFNHEEYTEEAQYSIKDVACSLVNSQGNNYVFLFERRDGRQHLSGVFLIEKDKFSYQIFSMRSSSYLILFANNDSGNIKNYQMELEKDNKTSIMWIEDDLSEKPIYFKVFDLNDYRPYKSIQIYDQEGQSMQNQGMSENLLFARNSS